MKIHLALRDGPILPFAITEVYSVSALSGGEYTGFV
jgi:hypothetical protein